MKRLSMVVSVLAWLMLGTAGAAYAWVPGASQGPIAYSSDANVPKASYAYNIWAVNADGSDRHQITHDKGQEAIQPSWSPSGQQIVFAVQSGNPFVAAPEGIRVVNFDGSHQATLTTGQDTRPHFSPDGSHIAYVHETPSSSGMPLPAGDIWVMNADGGAPHGVTHFPPGTDIIDLSWSPDGTQLVFTSDYGQPEETSAVFVMSASGGTPHAVTPPGDFGVVDWSPAGIAVENGPTLQTLPATGAGSLHTVTGGSEFEPSWAPNARAGSGLLATVHRVGHELNGQIGIFNPASHVEQTITTDRFNKGQPAWGPRLVFPVPLGPWFVPERTLNPAAQAFPLLVHCPASAGNRGCHASISATLGTLVARVAGVRMPAGRSRTIYVHFTRRFRALIHAGENVTFRLIARVGGHTRISSIRAHVYLPATTTRVCPAAIVSAGDQVTFSGRLLAALRGNNLRPLSGARVGLAFNRPDGTAAMLVLPTDAQGRFEKSFALDQAGDWTIQALWNGDRNHAAASSTPCVIHVHAVKPHSTHLAMTCPASGSVGQAMSVQASLTPGVPSQTITITYTRVGSTEVITHTLTTGPVAVATAHVLDALTPDATGTWSIQAFYAGNTAYEASSATCTTTVQKQSTSLTLSCPSKLTVKSQISVTGALSPPLGGAPITITYTAPDSTTVLDTATTAADGSYGDSTAATQIGTWTIQASYAGDATHAAATSATCTTTVEQ